MDFGWLGGDSAIRARFRKYAPALEQNLVRVVANVLSVAGDAPTIRSHCSLWRPVLVDAFVREASETEVPRLLRDGAPDRIALLPSWRDVGRG